jgi:hypothetical protein
LADATALRVFAALDAADRNADIREKLASGELKRLDGPPPPLAPSSSTAAAAGDSSRSRSTASMKRTIGQFLAAKARRPGAAVQRADVDDTSAPPWMLREGELRR